MSKATIEKLNKAVDASLTLIRQRLDQIKIDLLSVTAVSFVFFLLN